MEDRAYQLLIFDWDGTLLDSHHYIIYCVQQACRDLDLECPEQEVIRSVIGLSMEHAIRKLLPEASVTQSKRLIEAYRKHFLSPERPKASLFPDAIPVLSQFKDAGYQLSIATGKSRSGLNRDLDELGIADWFVATRTTDECESKPSPDMVESLLSELLMEPKDALVIGDSEYDILMAEYAKVDSVAMTYGVPEAKQFQEMSCLTSLDSLQGLMVWLQGRRSA